MVNEDGTLVQNPNLMENEENSDFTADDLALLKKKLLDLEQTIDEIKLPNLAIGGETFTGGYIFSLLEKVNVRKPEMELEPELIVGIFQITQRNVEIDIKLLDTLVTYLATGGEAAGSVFRRGTGLQYIHEFLQIVFASSAADLRARMDRCYKVYIEPEPQKPVRANKPNESGWIQSKAMTKTKSIGKSVSFWCFSPGFG